MIDMWIRLVIRTKLKFDDEELNVNSFILAYLSTRPIWGYLENEVVTLELGFDMKKKYMKANRFNLWRV